MGPHVKTRKGGLTGGGGNNRTLKRDNAWYLQVPNGPRRLICLPQGGPLQQEKILSGRKSGEKKRLSAAQRTKYPIGVDGPPIERQGSVCLLGSGGETTGLREGGEKKRREKTRHSQVNLVLRRTQREESNYTRCGDLSQHDVPN